MKMQKFKYEIVGPRSTANAGKSFYEFSEYGEEDFKKMISMDTGFRPDEIAVTEIQDATPEEILFQKSRNKYFERWGTACE